MTRKATVNSTVENPPGRMGAEWLSDAAVRSVFTGVVALFSLHAALRMAQDIFPAYSVPQKGLVWIQALAVFFILFYETGIPALQRAVRELVKSRGETSARLVRKLCVLGTPVVFGWSCYRYAKSCQIDLEDGACATAVQFLDKFNRHLHTSIQIWQGKEQWMGMALAFWTLVIFLGVLLAALVLHRRVLLLLFPVTVLALELLIGYIPQGGGMALLFAALLFVQADGGGAKQADLVRQPDQRQRGGWQWYVCAIPAGCLTAAVVLLLSVSGALTDATQGWLMERARQVQVFQQSAEKNMKDIWRGQFLQKKEGVNNNRPQYLQKEMLRVTASQCPSEDVLLKGFCGTDYQEGGWVSETQPFADACIQAGYDGKEAAKELLEAKYDLYAYGADRIVWYHTFGGGFVSIGSEEHSQTSYTVKHTGVRSQYAFVPYTVSAEGIEGDSYVADASVKKRRGQRVFTYDGWRRFNGSAEIDRVPEEKRKKVFQWYDRFVKTVYLATSDRVPTLDEYLQNYFTDQEEWYTAAGVFTSKKQSLQIRNWLMLLYLSQDMDAGDAVWRNESRMKIAQALRETLQQYQTYSLDLDPLAEGADPVWYFLMESRKGYCVHFASAAVLLLRELGVPARYASGYVARVSDFKKNGDVYVASVKDSSAHAWAEIYLDQIGWVPVDVTPADAGTYEQAPPGADDQMQDREQTQTDTDDTQTDIDDTQTDTDDTQTDADDTQADDPEQNTQTDPEHAAADHAGSSWLDALAGVFSGSNGSSAAWQQKAAVVLFVFVLPLLAACWLIWRGVRIWHAVVEREIKAGKYSAAVRRVNRRIYRRMRVSRKVPKQEISDVQYEHALKLAWRQIPQEAWTRYMEIARKAAYAKENVVSRQEAEFCLQIYREVFRKIQKRVKC